MAATPVHAVLGWLPRTRFLVWVTIALAVGWAYGVWSQPRPARLLDLRELDGVAVRGGVLDLMATVDQARPCLSEARRWLWRVDPEDPAGVEWVYLRDPPYRPPLEVGQRQRYRVLIPIPAYVEPGLWHYYGETEDRCPAYLPAWLVQLVWPERSSPDVKVRITDPTPADPAQVVAPPGAITVIPLESKP